MTDSGHPILEKIDFRRPYFRRAMIRMENGIAHDCELQLWLPVQLGNGVWVAAVCIKGLEIPIAAMPGDDPLGALISALAFARDQVNHQAGHVLFNDWQSGGLPVFLDQGFSPSKLADVEAQALRMAVEFFKEYG